MTSRSAEPLEAPRETILQQRDRILSSGLFRTSERSSGLLRFLVEQAINGRSDRLKEYTIGTEALGKGTSFDPRTDPIVRTEVSRLRQRLEKYYTTEGQADSLLIVLPKGKYMLQFEPRKTLPASVPKLGLRQAWSHRAVWVALGFAAAACALLLLWVLDRTSEPKAQASIAVLPFENMSDDKEQDFFSDGITEEITTALARVPDLRVIARASAFRFKNDKKDIVAIGHTLGAAYLIDGSVRKDGGRLRIAAQLIRIVDGVTVWADSYDRQLTNVFDIQEEIARTISTSLSGPLKLSPGENLVKNRSIDPDAYQQYLRAKAMIHARGLKNLTDGAAILEDVVKHQPDYAPAWAELALADNFIPNFHPAWTGGDPEGMRKVADAVMPKAEAAARRAIELDPNLADGYAMLAHALEVRGEWTMAEDLFKKALALDPNNPDVLHLYSRLIAATGRLKESLAMRLNLQALDPFQPTYNSVTSWLLWLNGQTDAANALGGALPDAIRGWSFPQLLASAGRYGEAANVVGLAPADFFPADVKANAARLLLSAPNLAPSPRDLPRLGFFGFVYLYVGAPDRVMDFYEAGVNAHYSVSIVTAYLWHPTYASVRKTERFKAFLRNVGLVEYWQQRGWPEFCHPTGSEDFVCS